MKLWCFVRGFFRAAGMRFVSILCRSGYRVSIGKDGESEIDFLLEKNGVQETVFYYFQSGDRGWTMFFGSFFVFKFGL